MPLSAYSKETITLMIETLGHPDFPIVLDSLSAPMIGRNQKIAMFSMKLRNSHMRDLPKETGFTYGDRNIVMINPKVQPESHSKSSWQYESNL